MKPRLVLAMATALAASAMGFGLVFFFDVSAIVAALAIVLLVLTPLAALGHVRMGPSAGFVVAAAGLGLVPIAAYLMRVEAARPLIESYYRRFSSDTEDAVVALLFLTSVVIAVLIAFFAPRTVAPVVKIASRGVFAAGLLVTALAAYKIATKPQLDGFVRSFDIVGTLPEGTPGEADGRHAGNEHVVHGMGFSRGAYCTLYIHPPGDFMGGFAPGKIVGVRGPGCGAYVVRYAGPPLDLWVLEGTTDRRWDDFAFTGKFAPIDISYHQLAAHVAPPPSWVAAAVVSLALACAWLVAFGRVRNKLARLASRTQGHHTGGGWVELPLRDQKLHVPSLERALAGPVLISGLTEVASGYRGTDAAAAATAAPVDAVPGLATEVTDRAMWVSLSADAMALVIVLFGAMVLFVAVLSGDLAS